MVIFHSYVSLPEGTYVFPNNEQPTKKTYVRQLLLLQLNCGSYSFGTNLGEYHLEYIIQYFVVIHLYHPQMNMYI